MKKIFTIAFYDFKRLVLNPITTIVFILLLGACVLLGSTIKIPTTPAYSAEISGETSSEIYSNFKSYNSTQDTKENLDEILDQANDYIKINSEAQSLDYSDLIGINNRFQTIKSELAHYSITGHCAYDDSINYITNSAYMLKDFLDHFKTLKELQSNLLFTKSQFQTLEKVNEFMINEVTTASSTTEHLNVLLNNISLIDNLDNVTKNAFRWKANPQQLEKYQEKYIKTALEKKELIANKIEEVFEKTYSTDAEKTAKLKSLITNYKLTCESAKKAVEIQLRSDLKNNFGDLNKLYGYTAYSYEEEQLALIKAEHFLQDEGLFYTQHQQPLNFYSASYDVSLFDYAYLLTSIIGFVCIIFGIFCVYKLFGRDRKSGKMDVLLSKNVTFGQVFSGKFLAIVMSTSFFLLLFASLSLLWGSIFYSTLPNQIMAVFNLSKVYFINPFAFFLVKLLGIELQVIFYSVIALFIMNLSRKFELNFAIALAIFAIATICNIFLNGSLVYCFFPFIHADLTSFLGGGTMQTGFLKTSLYAYGNFFISAVYYLVIVVLFYNFTKQIFKKN